MFNLDGKTIINKIQYIVVHEHLGEKLLNVFVVLLDYSQYKFFSD